MIEVRGCVTVSVMLGIHVGSSGSREAGAGGRRFLVKIYKLSSYS